MRVSDIPGSIVSWGDACGDLIETVLNWYPGYDPQDPQKDIIHLKGVDWKDPETQASRWGVAYLRANWSEVDWSTDPANRVGIRPTPPVMVMLTAKAERGSGMLQVWSPRREISMPGEELALNAAYDSKSSEWPKGYLDDFSRDGEIGRLRLPGFPESGNGSAYVIP